MPVWVNMRAYCNAHSAANQTGQQKKTPHKLRGKIFCAVVFKHLCFQKKSKLFHRISLRNKNILPGTRKFGGVRFARWGRNDSEIGRSIPFDGGEFEDDEFERKIFRRNVRWHRRIDVSLDEIKQVPYSVSGPRCDEGFKNILCRAGERKKEKEKKSFVDELRSQSPQTSDQNKDGGVKRVY